MITKHPCDREVGESDRGDGMTEAEVRERERFEDAMLLVLEMEEGATSQGMQVVSRNWKRQERRFLLRPPEVTQLY